MISEELKKLAWREVLILHLLTSDQEKQNLDFSKLSPCSLTCSIYGMMTGSSFNQRANTLAHLCGNEYSCTLSEYTKPHNKFKTRDYTALEFYCSLEKANIAAIIAYLKGEKAELELTEL